MTQIEIPEVVRHLRSPQTIRSRAQEMFRYVQSKQSPYFFINEEALPGLAKQVAEVTNDTYPDGHIPYHSRFRHFSAGGLDRLQDVREQLSSFDPQEQARRLIELVIVSVLLDAGAGPSWSYLDARDGVRYTRSEGLAIASLDMFLNGAFSSDPSDPIRVDQEGLKTFDESVLIKGFQINKNNPLKGLSGRASLVQQLSSCMTTKSSLFGSSDRLGMVVPLLHPDATAKDITAESLLAFLLEAFADIWPGRIEIEGHNLGDVWKHRALDGDGLIPFHKLSQWLTYSLIEPLEEHGYVVANKEALTGLAEYRNGGLFIDGSVLTVRDTSLLHEDHKPSDEIIVEWRALTLALLDILAPLVRKELSRTEEELALAQILEGGTWATGRVLAKRLRPDGSPPLRIQSDGTIF